MPVQTAKYRIISPGGAARNPAESNTRPNPSESGIPNPVVCLYTTGIAEYKDYVRHHPEHHQRAYRPDPDSDYDDTDDDGRGDESSEFGSDDGLDGDA